MGQHVTWVTWVTACDPLTHLKIEIFTFHSISTTHCLLLSRGYPPDGPYASSQSTQDMVEPTRFTSTDNSPASGQWIE